MQKRYDEWVNLVSDDGVPIDGDPVTFARELLHKAAEIVRKAHGEGCSNDCDCDFYAAAAIDKLAE